MIKIDIRKELNKMNKEETIGIMKAFLMQVIRGIDRAELKQGESNFADLQLKKMMTDKGDFYGLNFLIILENKEDRDKIAELLTKSFFSKGQFVEIGGLKSAYKITEKTEFMGDYK